MNENQAADEDFKAFVINHVKSGKASKKFEAFVGDAVLFVWEQNHFVDDDVWDELERIEQEFKDNVDNEQNKEQPEGL
jgi:hypothetical protein